MLFVIRFFLCDSSLDFDGAKLRRFPAQTKQFGKIVYANSHFIDKGQQIAGKETFH